MELTGKLSKISSIFDFSKKSFNFLTVDSRLLDDVLRPILSDKRCRNHIYKSILISTLIILKIELNYVLRKLF